MPDTDDLEHPKTDDEILRKVKQMRSDGLSGSANFFDRMRKAEDFVIGGDFQWDPAVKEAARLKGKFTLTIPIIKPQIKQVAGTEIQNPQDFIIENTRVGTATVARILTALTKQATDSELVRYEQSQTFESGLNSGQGAIGVFLDKTDDPRHANLRIERLVEHNSMIDPNCTSYNPNKRNTGAKWVIWEEWVDKEMVEAEYPEKKMELEARGSDTFFGVVIGNIHGIIDWMTGRRSTKETSSFSARERTDIEVMVKSRYLVSHTWWREPKKCLHWYDNRKSEIDSLFLCKDKEIALAKRATKESEEAAKIREEQAIQAAIAAGLDRRRKEVRDKIKKAGTPIFSIEEVVSYVMHHTIRVKDTFLEDRADELNGVQMFPICFFWPYWINGFKSGIAEDLIGTQEELNWLHSMELNLIKLLANTGWKIKEDLAGDFADWLAAHGGEDGVVVDESRGGGTVDKLEPSPFPTAFALMKDRAKEDARTITNVRTEVPEKDEKALSGRAIFLKQQSEIKGSMSLMNNWFYTLAILGDLIVDIVRKNDIFSEDEIREIVDSEDLIDSEFMEEATQIVIAELGRQGINIPEQPTPPDPNVLQQAESVVQQTMINNFQQDTALFQRVMAQVAQMARGIAEGMLIDSIHSMKAGKYSTKVTTSPMAPTMRVIKAAEKFELHKVLRESGDVGLNPDDLIDATDVADKEKLKRGRQQLVAAVQGAA